jgi:AAA domain, putative AbiEii toxin, Type IV TA system/Overcoming lysogenization defect protein-like, TOPRIM domain
LITHVHLKSGSSPGQPPLVLETPPSVTIFVGPNNSGKSQGLREIFTFCNSGQHTVAVIVDKLTFAPGDPSTVRAELETIKVTANPGEHVGAGVSIIKIGKERLYVRDQSYIQARISPNENPTSFATWHLRHSTLNLDGPGRIGLVDPQGRGDLKNPTTELARILTNDEKRAALRKVIHDALGLYFAVDAQAGDQLQVRLGLTPPPDERSFNDAALEYMGSALGIAAVSDGVKAYTGVLLQLHAGDPKVIIIDEPEAFLHPSLAFKLGKELAGAAGTEGKRVFAATHSPHFVMGAILSGATVNIIRLTYEGSIGTARLLPCTELTKLMQDPLLRSAGVLSGLFYNSVIVCEADADRAFYQEINERLLAADDPRGIPHGLFLNADNKQTIPRIVEPLRKLGIPCAAIADLDIVKDGGEEWTRHLRACNIPASEHEPYSIRRTKVLDALQDRDSEFKRRGGINLLSGAERETAGNLFGDLARYGLFVVERGEVEAWLSDLEVSRSKQSWLRSIFEKMGSDPSSLNYVKPAPGDVWDFLGRVRTWLADPERRGIPR